MLFESDSVVLVHNTEIYATNSYGFVNSLKLRDMKTAEEILESHLTSMLSRVENSYVTIDEMKQVPVGGNIQGLN